MPLNFCGQLRTQIAQILEKELFSIISGNTIKTTTILDWYDYFTTCLINKNFPYIFAPFTIGMNYIGHDLPVWIEGDPFKNSQQGSFKGGINDIQVSVNQINSNQRVMIIGQDPLRTSANFNQLSVMSPWGLHYPYGYNGKHARFYNWIICPILAKQGGRAIYVTDYYKLYATNFAHNKSRNNIINSRNNVGSLPNVNFTNILEKEMLAFNPTSVVILGINTPYAQNVIQLCNNLKIRQPIIVYHPNAHQPIGANYFQQNVVSRV